jgi:hypothetical protein
VSFAIAGAGETAAAESDAPASASAAIAVGALSGCAAALADAEADADDAEPPAFGSTIDEQSAHPRLFDGAKECLLVELASLHCRKDSISGVCPGASGIFPETSGLHPRRYITSLRMTYFRPLDTVAP